MFCTCCRVVVVIVVMKDELELAGIQLRDFPGPPSDPIVHHDNPFSSPVVTCREPVETNWTPLATVLITSNRFWLIIWDFILFRFQHQFNMTEKTVIVFSISKLQQNQQGIGYIANGTRGSDFQIIFCCQQQYSLIMGGEMNHCRGCQVMLKIIE